MNVKKAAEDIQLFVFLHFPEEFIFICDRFEIFHKFFDILIYFCSHLFCNFNKRILSFFVSYLNKSILFIVCSHCLSMVISWLARWKMERVNLG